MKRADGDDRGRDSGLSHSLDCISYVDGDKLFLGDGLLVQLCLQVAPGSQVRLERHLEGSPVDANAPAAANVLVDGDSLLCH